MMMVDRCRPFEELAFPGDEERIRTRLGEEGARVVFEEPMPQGPFGEPVSEIVLAAQLSQGLDLDSKLEIRFLTKVHFMFLIGDKWFQYDRYGVRRGGGNPNELAYRSDHSGRDIPRR